MACLDFLSPDECRFLQRRGILGGGLGGGFPDPNSARPEAAQVEAIGAKLEKLQTYASTRDGDSPDVAQALFGASREFVAARDSLTWPRAKGLAQRALDAVNAWTEAVNAYDYSDDARARLSAAFQEAGATRAAAFDVAEGLVSASLESAEYNMSQGALYRAASALVEGKAGDAVIYTGSVTAGATGLNLKAIEEARKTAAGKDDALAGKGIATGKKIAAGFGWLLDYWYVPVAVLGLGAAWRVKKAVLG